MVAVTFVAVVALVALVTFITLISLVTFINGYCWRIKNDTTLNPGSTDYKITGRKIELPHMSSI